MKFEDSPKQNKSNIQNESEGAENMTGFSRKKTENFLLIFLKIEH